MAANDRKMFTVDKFLGLNEFADSNTELKQGEASRMVNWFLTDGYNLEVRPGIQPFADESGEIIASWAGDVGDVEYMCIVDIYHGTDRVRLYAAEGEGARALTNESNGLLGLTGSVGAHVKIYPFDGKLYIMASTKTIVWASAQWSDVVPYVPLVIIGAAPAGGGTNLENINLMTSLRRVEFSSDGATLDYIMPDEAISVTKVVVDNVSVESPGAFDQSTHTFKFASVPAKGTGNVEITYDTDHAATEEYKARIARQPLVEAFNGSTDTRLFYGGDGNVIFYTGVTQVGRPDALYIPGGNEITVDMSGANVTGMVRHYSKLMVFTTDSTYAITYSPTTLEDGSMIAGFYLRPVSKEYGHDYVSKIQTVNNYPRTFSNRAIYEWRVPTNNSLDERYAKRVSDTVQRTLSKSDVNNIVTADDDREQTFYAFLNDDEGTVLVNRYALANEGGLWCLYKSQVAKGVKNAFVHANEVVFVREDGIFYFSRNVKYDSGEKIISTWESGFQHFGNDARRKYTSIIYVSMLPKQHSYLRINAATDKRSEYMDKYIRSTVFTFANTDFRLWTFDTNTTPKIKRVRLKVKKFVYYKLVLTVDEPGADATVLGFDQEVRFAAMAK